MSNKNNDDFCLQTVTAKKKKVTINDFFCNQSVKKVFVLIKKI